MGKIFSHIFSQVFKARMTTASTARLQSHCKVSVRASEACSGLQQASQISGNYTAYWRTKNRDWRKMSRVCLGPLITHSLLPLCILQAPSHLSQNLPCSAASFTSSMHALGPCLTPCTLVFPQKPAAGHTGVHTCRPQPTAGPEPSLARTGSVRGSSVLLKQAGHGDFHK